MAILNKTNVPYLTTEGVRFLDETGIDKVYNFVPHSHQDYWVVQFLHANDLTDENLKIAIPEEIRQKVRDKQVWLIFNNFLEAYHGVVEPIYQKAIITQKEIFDYLCHSNNIKNVKKIITHVYSNCPIYNLPQEIGVILGRLHLNLSF